MKAKINDRVKIIKAINPIKNVFIGEYGMVTNIDDVGYFFSLYNPI